MEFVIKAIELANKAQRGGNPAVVKAKKEEIATAEKVLAWLEDGKRVANGQWTNSEIAIINTLTLLTAKPSVYIVNVSEEDYILGADDQGTQWMKEINQWVNDNSPGDRVVPVSIGLEARLAGLDQATVDAELKDLDTQSALPIAIQELRKALHLISYFTCGKDEVREWTIRKGTKAPQAAGIIHKDLEKTFILANVTKYDDLVAANGDDSVIKASGQLSQKGKDYVVEDGDVVHFKSAAARK
ncbi:Ola1p [Sugiyamaella lignohabitans]|uniref:Ola1p n=1 Tax=Sugiyamaella lignohabitans TaxID=796027 RepID=A0A167C607_9ASCO|nr:Ola1p [Sugiyamaella lignohabitans]ANB11263.1 Ola1p [Sugiyamaella lignohabitans]